MDQAGHHPVDDDLPPDRFDVVRLRQPVLGAELRHRLGTERTLQVAVEIDQRQLIP